MALIKCKECGSEVSNKAKTCPKCGVKVGRETMGCGSVIAIIVIVWTVGKIYSMATEPPSPAPAPAPVSTSQGPRSSSPAPAVSRVRQGWLLDADRRGEVALWAKPAQPFQDGNTIAAVVAFRNLPLGESMITDVTEERMVGGIYYYYIRFDDERQGWVDVDYLHWKKVRR